MRIHKKASKTVLQGASHRMQIQKNIVAIVAVIVVMMLFWLSAVPALNWFDRSGDAEQLRIARSAWQAAGVRDYKYDFQLRCLCGDAMSEPVSVEVRGAEFLRFYDRATSTLRDPADFQALPQTIDQVFDHVSSYLDSRPDVFEAGYDSRLGFPEFVRVDPDSSQTGDEVGYYVTQFSKLAAGNGDE